MSNSTTVFVKSQWLALGKQWKDLPPRIKKTGKGEFSIPAHIRLQVLPASGLSINDLLEFPLPKSAISTNQLDVNNFFSRENPDIWSEAVMFRLRRLPTPSVPIIQALVSIQHQAWLDGYKSVQYTHLGHAVTTHFLLWLVSFWVAVIDMEKAVRRPWSTTREQLRTELHQRVSVEQKTLAADANSFLAKLPWDSEPVRTLWRFLGPHWTTSSQQNDMLDELADRIHDVPELRTNILAHNSFLSAKIIQLAASRESCSYSEAKCLQWLRTLGEQIANGKKLLTEHHLGKDNPHWVSLVIDGSEGKMLYGDSYHHEMPLELREAFNWWLSHHVPVSFTVKNLPISTQEPTDTSSCGILVNNSLDHYTFPTIVPLLRTSEVKAARSMLFLRTAQEVLDQV